MNRDTSIYPSFKTRTSRIAPTNTKGLSSSFYNPNDDNSDNDNNDENNNNSSSSTYLKLFLTGATLGPIVDSLHNQCLLQYDRASILIPSLFSNDVAETTGQTSYIFASSWYIPPLLGVAYVVLGSLLPNLFQYLLSPLSTTQETTTATTESLRTKALLAVTSTALIIKLSDYLQTHPSIALTIQQQIQPLLQDPTTASINLGIMIAAVLLQWITLDTTFYGLLTAIIVAIGGPLSELPFVQFGFWHYIPSATDYYPLMGMGASSIGMKLNDFLLNSSIDVSNLALSSITGPCYFAVTMDAIALGRWFSSSSSSSANSDANANG